MAKTSKQAKRKTTASRTRSSKPKTAAKTRSTQRTSARGSGRASSTRAGTKTKSKTPKRAGKAGGPRARRASKPAGSARTSNASRAGRTGKSTKVARSVKAKTKSKSPAARKGTSATAGAAAGKKPAGKRPSVADRARKAVARNAKHSRTREESARAKPSKPAEKPRKKTRVRTKSPYSRRSLAPLRTVLLSLRTRLVGDIDLMGREALRADDPDVDAENVADHGSDAFERHMTLELMENEARTIRQINAALDLMDGGSYGLCGICNEPIPLARLQALPFAENCVGCQAAQERRL